MKKFIVLLLTAVMSLTMFVTAFAESDTEITFRGIPWGTTYKEFKESYNDLEADVSKDPNVYGFNKLYNPSTGLISIYEGIEATDSMYFMVYAPSLHDYLTNMNEEERPIVCQVAGYDVVQVWYMFMLPVIPETGYLSTDVETAKLYGTKYIFRNTDNNYSMVSDLTNKLTYLYGDPIDSTNNYSYYWMDSRGNWVHLKYTTPSNNGEYTDAVVLEYYSGTVYEDLAEIESALMKEHQDNGEMEGL